MAYQINSIEELKHYFIDNNINTSNDLANLGSEYWNKTLKPLISPILFKKPKNKEELKQLIKEEYPLLLIDTICVNDFLGLFENEINKNKNLKTKEYWKDTLNYLGYWNTKNVVDMSYCFYRQTFFNQRLYWNTKKVKDISHIFLECEKYNQPTELDLSSCENISYMFNNCKNLNSFIILKNTNNVKDASSLFQDCESFNQPVELNLYSCKDISYMFYGCTSLNRQVKLKNTYNVIYADLLFYKCKNYNQSIELDLSSCKDVSNMCSKCENLNSPVILKNLNNVENIENVFNSCKNLKIKNIKKELLLILIKKLSNNFIDTLKEWEIKYDKEYIDKLYTKTNVKLISDI